ncbi:MAG: preprotein translocase subunit SecE [Bacteroidetes bacterium SW_10_40_5]|nr:MAG: preprotein translocase subunit SecE [Bacteroidetes bacterium SW_10_40_5]
MFQKIQQNLRLTVEELLYKVTWPTWEELQSSAIVTLITSLIIALIVFMMDSAFENIFKVFYTIFE